MTKLVAAFPNSSNAPKQRLNRMVRIMVSFLCRKKRCTGIPIETLKSPKGEPKF